MKQDTNHGLIVVSAPSGAGKSTLCGQLLQAMPDRVALSISSTSRKPRGQEKHGKEYFFLENADFQKRIEAGEFAEWASVHNNFYGTQKQMLQDFWNSKKHVLLDIDVQGADSLKKAYPDRCFTVFIAPPSIEELERRLRGRGTETEDAIQRRMANAVAELKRQNEFDLILVNDDLSRTYQQLHQAVTRFMDELEGGVWQKRP